jgi:hypothetical protein
MTTVKVAWMKMPCPACAMPVSALTYAALFTALVEHAHGSASCAPAVHAQLDEIAAGDVRIEYQILPEASNPDEADPDRSGD